MPGRQDLHQNQRSRLLPDAGPHHEDTDRPALVELAVQEHVQPEHTLMKLTVPEPDQADHGLPGHGQPGHEENSPENQENGGIPPNGARNQGAHPPDRKQKPRLD